MDSANAASEHNLAPTIIWEDELLLALNKPAGLVVHTDGRTVEPTLSDWVLEKYPSLKEVGEAHSLDNGKKIPRAGVLHRLDRETSGVILVAKTEASFQFLQKQFLDHKIKKTYLAYVEGKFEKEEGVIDLAIGRSRSDFRHFATGDDARGTLRDAVTNYRVIKTSGQYSLIELSPETGRTHQLRVHLLAIGHPILADARYGSQNALGFTRVALHAAKLEFTHPNGTPMSAIASIPADFEAAKRELMEA